MRSPRSPRSPTSPRAGPALWLAEFDGAGRVATARAPLAAFLAGRATAPAVAAPPWWRSPAAALRAAFLPEGYPGSVTPDYGAFWCAPPASHASTGDGGPAPG